MQNMLQNIHQQLSSDDLSQVMLLVVNILIKSTWGTFGCQYDPVMQLLKSINHQDLCNLPTIANKKVISLFLLYITHLMFYN